MLWCEMHIKWRIVGASEAHSRHWVLALCFPVAQMTSTGQGGGRQEMSRLSVSLVGRAGARRETIGANSEE